MKEVKRMLNQTKRIPGDASTRRYYRIDGDPSCIVMKMESFADQGDQLPFLEVQRHLDGLGLPVPKVYEADPRAGLILLEDLGDRTLLHELEKVSDIRLEAEIYQKVIDLLVDLQVKAGPARDMPRISGFDLKFDFKKLMWEVDFAIEHFYQKHLRREFKTGDLKILRSGFSRICETLAKQPVVFTHRDLHSRNIMVAGKGKNSRLVLIDFQDARMGLPQYDLASLLKDSYYQLAETQIDKLIHYYIKKYQGESGKKIDSAEFKYLFDLMSVQRNFKAIGSFASFSNLRDIQTYLKYIGNTFENIRRALLKYPEFSDLREVLFHYYYF